MGKRAVGSDRRGYKQSSWGGDYTLDPTTHSGGAPARNWIGERVPASRDGQQIISADTQEPLWTPSESSRDGGSAAGDAIGGLTVGLLFVILELVGVLYRRYPRGMIGVHLVVGTAGMAYLNFGFGSLYGLVLLIFTVSWPWIWLTMRLPYILWPVNAALFGGGLWRIADRTRTDWQPYWIVAAKGIPLIGDLQALVAVLPMAFLAWVFAARRWPTVMAVPTRIAIGAVLWFTLFRIGAGWLPQWLPWWEYVFWPLPIIAAAPAACIALFPVALWIWWNPVKRVPLLFGALFMLVVGTISFLVAFHLLPLEQVWRVITGDLDFAQSPVQSLLLLPLVIWLWTKLWRRWPRVVAVPSLILVGVLGWDLFERTRVYWAEYWPTLLGPLPPALDPAILALVLPLSIWVIMRVLDRWPQCTGIVRATTFSLVLWMVVARTQQYWQAELRSIPTILRAQLALFAAVLPIAVWLVFRVGALAIKSMH